MNKVPELVNKNTKIMVKLLVEIINDFFEPLSYKSMIFLIVMMTAMMIVQAKMTSRKK